MAKNAVDAAVERIDAQISDLERAKAILLAARTDEAPAAPKVRKKRKQRGLPTTEEPSL